MVRVPSSTGRSRNLNPRRIRHSHKVRSTVERQIRIKCLSCEGLTAPQKLRVHKKCLETLAKQEHRRFFPRLSKGCASIEKFFKNIPDGQRKICVQRVENGNRTELECITLLEEARNGVIAVFDQSSLRNKEWTMIQLGDTAIVLATLHGLMSTESTANILKDFSTSEYFAFMCYLLYFVFKADDYPIPQHVLNMEFIDNDDNNNFVSESIKDPRLQRRMRKSNENDTNLLHTQKSFIADFVKEFYLALYKKMESSNFPDEKARKDSLNTFDIISNYEHDIGDQNKILAEVKISSEDPKQSDQEVNNQEELFHQTGQPVKEERPNSVEYQTLDALFLEDMIESMQASMGSTSQQEQIGFNSSELSWNGNSNERFLDCSKHEYF